MSDHDVKMIILSTDDLDESIRFYSETLGMSLKFRDDAHERRAVVYDNKGNGVVFYKPLAR
jgi:catechol 2,3-dioxygenase-like lactoylglutathione lyase family enzyme